MPDGLINYFSWLLGLLAWVTGTAAAATPAPGPVVAVTGGRVEGVRVEGVLAYKGIPFAAPPVGGLRWKDPRPVTHWNGVRKADAFAPACAQSKPPFGLPSSEDCLYLNVWTAAHSAHARLPVMVWIHGGGFTAGATAEPPYDGLRFAQQGVVLVSIAYRLGPFGFLTLPQLDAEGGHSSGNYGLRDMIAALEWVRANVATFGGDPHRVTIAGESAGGTAVSLLAVAPAARGLFERIIAESDDATFRPPRFSLYARDQSGPIQTKRFGESVGEALLRELGAADLAAARALPAAAILKAVEGRGALWTGPVIDGVLLPEPNRSLYRSGRFNDTPILIGSNSDEGHGRAPPAIKASALRDQTSAFMCPQKAQAVLAGYPLESDAQAPHTLEMLIRDDGYAWNTWSWARWQARSGRAAAFLYYFDLPMPRFPNGAPHWTEVPYVFANFGWFDEQHMPLRPEDLAASDLIRRYWINFIETGNPNGRNLPHWPAFNEHTARALVFDREPGARELPNLGRLRALDAWHDCVWASRRF